MKINFEKVKIRVGKKGSFIIGVVLFAVAFLITMSIMKASTKVTVDRYEHGKTIRQIVDSENGDVVLVINDIQYYEKDLRFIIESFKISEPQYSKLQEEQVKSIAGSALVQQKLLLIEFDKLGLEVTDDELLNYIANLKEVTDKAIEQKNSAADDILQYIAGYGCTYSEFWKDANVIKQYEEELKLSKTKEAICKLKGYSKVKTTVVNAYLTDKIKTEEYKILLFGEEYK